MDTDTTVAPAAMSPVSAPEAADGTAVAGALQTITAELTSTVEALALAPEALESLARVVDDADRVFVLAAGRSGFALRMTAMRLMHLGRTVHVVGETTAPAIRPGDVLLTASGSGTTGGVLRSAEKARSAGARVAAVTATSGSPLTELADAVVVVPAAQKLDRSGAVSAQYAGGLFEQSVALLGDAIFHALWRRSGLTGDDLWPYHANLE